MLRKVARLVDIPEGSGAVVELEDGREVALFRDGGRVYALDSECPHRGASLAFGEVRGGVVHCPVHAWPFRLVDGTCPDQPKATVATYAVTVEGGFVYLEL